MLNSKNAFRLYDLVGRHLPEDVKEDDDLLDFVDRIVESMINSGEHKNYIEAVVIMTEEPEAKVIVKSTTQILDDFSSGLVENEILYLKEFCESVRYD